MPKSSWEIVFQKSAYKEYKKLPKKIRERIDESLEILSISPFNDILNFRKIRGKNHHYRIKIGDYRVIYTPRESVLVVRVIRVGHRKDVYKFF